MGSAGPAVLVGEVAESTNGARRECWPCRTWSGVTS